MVQREAFQNGLDSADTGGPVAASRIEAEDGNLARAGASVADAPGVPLPPNEDERLAALRRYGVLDSLPEPGFDRITALAARLFAVPVCVVSLVDEGRVWFKSRVGWSGEQVGRQESLCSFVVLQKDLLVIHDARQEERFACNLWVEAEPGIRFYAGAPLITPDGFSLGTLCIIDTQPRERFDEEDRQTLADLAAMVVDELELRLSLQRTERTAAALGESEQRFRNMADNAPVMIWVVDTAGVCTYLSRSWYDFTGQNEQTGLGFGWLDVVHPDDRENAKTAFQEALGRHEVFHLEYRLRHTDGIYRWVIDSAVPRLSLDGGFDGYIGSAIDITGRVRQESWIAGQNRVLEMIATGVASLNEMLDAIVHFIEEQTDRTVLCSILLLDKSRKRLNHGSAPSLPETYCRAIDGVAIGPQVGSCGTAAYRNETVVVTDISTDLKWEGLKDLALAHELVACWSTPIRDTRGKVLGTLAMYYRTARGPNAHEQKMVAVGENIAAIAIERWYAGEALAGDEQRYRLLTESIPQLVWTAEADGTMNDVNQRWSEYTGLSLEQVRAVGWEAVVHPDDLSALWKQWVAATEARAVYLAEGRMRRADGSYRWYLHRAVPQLDARGQIIKWFGTATEIEERKQLEAERERLLELERQARQSAEEANQAKDLFLAMLSHELRTPLNPIIGWTQLLRRGKLSPVAQENALEVIERNAKLQNQLIEDLLDVSRIKQGKFTLHPQPLSPEHVVDAAVETVRSLAQSVGVELEIQAAADLPWICADPTRLSQMVWNLLTNGIKFTPEGGRVGVRLEATVDTVRIEVRDSGIGITPEFLPRLFERFRQASEGSTRTRGGLGLGLFIVRHIAEAHGGRVWAESEGEGKGATFIVELPVAPL